MSGTAYNDRRRVVVGVQEKAGAMVIRLRRAGGEEFEVVTNGHVEQVADQEPVARPAYKRRFWWETEAHGEPSHSEGDNQPATDSP